MELYSRGQCLQGFIKCLYFSKTYNEVDWRLETSFRAQNVPAFNLWLPQETLVRAVAQTLPASNTLNH